MVYGATEGGTIVVWKGGTEVTRLSTCCGSVHAITVFNGVICCGLNSAEYRQYDIVEDIELITKASKYSNNS